jgi:hypothetical protein
MTRKGWRCKAIGIIMPAAIMLLMVSCFNRHRHYLIPEKQFVRFLTDLHLAEALGTTHANYISDYRIDSAGLYASVFRKHNVTRAMFDSTMAWYSLRPDKFEKIYNEVTASLKSLEEELEHEEQAGIRTELIWEDKRIYKFPPLGGDKIYIDVPISKTGTYSVSTKIKMLPDELSINPRMSVYFYSDNQSPEGRRQFFNEVKYTDRSGTEVEYEATETVRDRRFTHIRGYIVNYSNTDSLFERNMVVTHISITRKIEE